MIPSPTESQDPTLDQPQASPKKTSLWKDTLQFVLIIVFIVIPFRVYVAQPFIVSGDSMQPGFQDRDYLIVDQLSYRLNEPERGDVVIFKYPNNPKVFYIKRIIGLPGDIVTVRDDEVLIETIDSTERIKIEEPYVDSSRPNDSRTALLDDQYYVMGDNRLVSSDSRVWGPLDREFIVGKAFMRLFPFNEIDIHPEDYKLYPESL